MAILQLDNITDLRKAQHTLFDSTSKSGWVLINTIGSSRLYFAASGRGEITEISSHLVDDQMKFGLVRVHSGNVKDVLFEWIGKDVGMMELWRKPLHMKKEELTTEKFLKAVDIPEEARSAYTE